MSQPSSTSRFDRGARITLIFTATIFTLAAGLTAYRFTLPTDGWQSGEITEIDAVGYIYQSNVMGLPSGLQPGDHLVAVEGIALAEAGLPDLLSLKDTWRAGNTVRYAVLRGEGAVELDVPLTHWDVGQYLRETQSAADLVTYLGVFTFLGISLLAFWRRPENPAARALLVLATIVIVLYLVIDVLPAMVIDEVSVVSAFGGFLFGAALFSLLLPPAFIRFALVFPEPVPFLRRRPWLAFAPYGVGLLVFAAFVAQVFIFGWLWMATSTFITLAILIYSALTVRDAVGRAQLRWGLGGAIAGLGFFFLTYIPIFLPVPAPMENFLNATTGFGFGIMGIALGIAVLRYRLFDIDVIIRKTTSYAILTALLALVYFGSIVVLQRLLSPITGESDVAVVLSTLLIAALFLPLRRRVQAAIDRRFFRQKYDAEQVLAQFAATARDETDLDALTAELMRVIQETMEPESVSVWLRPAADQKPRTTDH
jgi:hypothetical protein